MIDQADKTNGTEKDLKLETLNYVLFETNLKGGKLGFTSIKLKDTLLSKDSSKGARIKSRF